MYRYFYKLNTKSSTNQKNNDELEKKCILSILTEKYKK
jgi:hypothetical protein